MDVTGLTGGLFRGLLRSVYPPRCVLCGAGGFDDRDLCARCYQNLSWLGPACVQCALPLPDTREDHLKCGRCLQKPPAFDRSLGLFAYQDDVIRLIHQLKFNQKLAYSRLLGNMLAEAVQRRGCSIPECIIPVPLHHKRLRQRGFNQSIELARPVARALNIVLDVGSVVRARNTQSQTGLDKKERSKNMRGAFELVREISANHVAIVDDVVTTSSTVNELARVLKAAGVERADVWSIARAI